MEQETIKESLEKASSIDIKDLIFIGISKWYWFVISLVIALGAATYYLLRTPPIYTRATTILIKDEEDSSDPFSKKGFTQFTFMRNATMIQNEILTLKSISLMQEVVERLGLNDSYNTRQGLRDIDAYKAHPIIISLLDSASMNSSFKISFELTSDNQVEFTLIKRGKEKWSENIKAPIGQAVATPVGQILTSRSPWFKKSMIGETYTYNHTSTYNAAKAFSGAIAADLCNDDANIIKISYAGPSIAKADDILHTLVQIYNEQWIKDKNQIAVSTYNFINERLGVIERELGEVDSDISSYKSENLLPDLEASSHLYMEQSAKNRTELMNVNNQLYMATFLRKELASGSITAPIPANSGIDNPALQAQISEYNTMVIERNRLLASSSETNPLVADLTNSLRALHKSIIISLDNTITALNTQLRGLQSQEAQATTHLAQSPNQARYLLSVERQQKVKESLYLYLLEKREENQLSQAFTAYNTRLIDAPYGDSTPTSPQPAIIYFLAIALGLIIPFGILFVRQSLNTKVRGKKDIEAIDIPLMGEIPQIQDESHRTIRRTPFKKIHRRNAGIKDIVVREGSRDVINEAFRVLRTNLEFVSAKSEGCNVIMITSFNPGSGKSLITMNLAIALGLRGKNVLVVDGDLRRASSSAFVKAPRIGLSNYLSGAIDDHKSIIVPLSGNRNVDVLPVGKIPPNPSELLSEQRMTSLINSLKPDYDYILIDCPPVDIVADTAVIASLADRTIFVIRAGLLERAMLAELETIYSEHRFNNMSLLLNCVPVSSGRYGYKYGYKYGHYGYSYGYGYGYGSYGGHSDDDYDADENTDNADFDSNKTI